VSAPAPQWERLRLRPCQLDDEAALHQARRIAYTGAHPMREVLPMLRLPKLPFLLLPLLPLAAFFAGCATAPPLASDLSPEGQRVERLLTLLRLPDFVERLQYGALHAAGHPSDVGIAMDQRLRPRIERELDPAAVTADVARRTAASLDEPSLAEAERFYASPTGAKLADAAGTAYSRWQRMRYRMSGQTAEHPPERVALVRRYEELARTGPTASQVYLRVHSAIVSWYESRNQIDATQVAAYGGVDGLRARERERTEAIANRHSIPFALFAFRDLSTPQLREYVARLESPAGQAFMNASRDALLAAIEARSAAIER
jgi:hypothetical protein